MSAKKIIVCNSCHAINRVDTILIQKKSPSCGKCQEALSSSPKVVSVQEDLLQKVIRNAELPVVIDAFADWCAPCKLYGPIFEEVAQSMWDKAEFYKLDTEKNPNFSSLNNIRGIPTTLIFQGGKLIKNKSGLLQKEHLLSMIEDCKR